MRFTLRQLSYFVAAGEAGGVKLAADRLHISQPSVSAAIAELEREFGVQLLVRHHAQGVSLTPEGRRLMAAAKALLQQAEELHVLAEELQTGIAGPITVAALSSIAPMIVPQLVRSFSTAHPQAVVTNYESNQSELLAKLRQNEIDVAITYDLEIPGDLTFECMCWLQPYAYCGETHPIRGRGAVTIAELAAHELVLLDAPLSREYFLSLFIGAGLNPRIGQRSAHDEVVRALVANGLGYGLANVPLRNGAALDGKPLHVVPISGGVRPLAVGMVTARQRARRPVVQAFEEHCRQCLPDILEDEQALRR